MDKPNINIRAWQPINKRKKTDEPKLMKQSISSDMDIYNNEPTIKLDAWNNNPQYYKYYKRADNIEKDFYINKKYSNNEYNKPKHKRKKKLYINTELFKTIGTGLGAIATGVFLGYIVLSFLFGSNNNQEELTNNPNNDTTIVNYIDNNQEITGQIIPEQTTYLIQAGVFSNLSGAEEIVKQQRGLGRSAVVKQDSSYYVFVGIAAYKEQANLLKELLTTEGVDLYTKEYVINEKKFNMGDETFTIFTSFINSGIQLVNILSESSIQALANPGYKINYDEIQRIHQEFLINIQTLKTSLEKENLLAEEDLIQNMSDQINYAIAAVNAYNKNPNSQYLWNIQELLIKYELYYEGYVKKI